MKYPRRLPVVVALIAVTVVACGGDTADTTSTSAGPGATAGPAGTTEATLDTSNGTTGVDRSGEIVGRWTIEFYRQADGARTNIVGDDPVFIEFASDGTLTFHTGCNPGSATYVTQGTYYVPESALDEEPEGQAVRISGLSTDSATCEGFLGDQDTDFAAALQDASRFMLDEGNLLLLDEFFLVEASPSS